MFNESTTTGSLMWLFIILFFGSVGVGIILGTIMVIWGLISTKLWNFFTVDFREDIDKLEEIVNEWGKNERK